MIREIHNPAHVQLNSKDRFFQIVLELDNGSIGFWTGNGFKYITDGFFEGKAIRHDELVPDYYNALSMAKNFNYTGTLAISSILSYAE